MSNGNIQVVKDDIGFRIYTVDGHAKFFEYYKLPIVLEILDLLKIKYDLSGGVI